METFSTREYAEINFVIVNKQIDNIGILDAEKHN